ncbi:peptidyl-prolyl cis-trans isomerase [Brevibacillus sp. SYSU BS000544]|uniref:peptidyl-prolyl cis-trans isomerase n=1 Tax=Brevibacillus sp. SYSU BS000544 TaxID=3416443 RepID=UPI003CE45EE6
MNNVRVLWGMIGGLILLLAVISWSWYKEMGHVQTMAVVGGQAISESDWVNELKQKHGQRVLTEMINHLVVLQEAKRLRVEVDENQVQAEMDKLAASYGGEQHFDDALKKEAGTSKQEVLEEVRYHMLLEEIATKDIVIDDKEMRSYYDSHSEEFNYPPRAHLSIITIASMEEAEQVRNELNQGANFSTLAKERSIDSLTAGNGGDMGWISLKDESVPATIREEAESLSVGKYSNPLSVDEGFAIIRLEDFKKPVQVSYEDAKEQIRRQMALAQVSLDEVLARLKQGAGVTIGSENSH